MREMKIVSMNILGLLKLITMLAHDEQKQLSNISSTE